MCCKSAVRHASPVQLARNYLNALAPRGGTRLYDDVDASGGTSTIRLPAGGKDPWVEVSVSNGGEAYSLTIVEEAAMAQQVEFTAANQKLSERRAAAVKAYLVSTFGIAADRLATAGSGDTKPAADNTDEKGRAQNRRVELVRKNRPRRCVNSSERRLRS